MIVGCLVYLPNFLGGYMMCSNTLSGDSSSRQLDLLFSEAAQFGIKLLLPLTRSNALFNALFFWY